MDSPSIRSGNVSEEQSSFAPPADFAANANATGELYAEAEADRLAFWAA